MMCSGSIAEYSAAAHILAAPVIAERTRLRLDPDHRWIDFETLLNHRRGWSRGEQLLVDAALDMWNGGGRASLGELINVLDAGNLNRVVEAIAIRRDLA